MLKDRILERLREAGAGEFVSGQELCEALGVSRTAVWKAVSRLREEGYPIEAVQNRGYRLDEARAESSDLLNEAELNARLSAATRWAGHPCYYAEETGSTNDDIMALADQGAPEGTLCVTSLQNKGKGRRGRRWISPDGGNVYMSLLVRPKMPTNIVPMVTIVMALAACEACQEVAGAAAEAGRNGGNEAGAPAGAGEDTRQETDACPAAAESGEQCFCPARFGIKWPNDIVVSSEKDPAWKKMTGILTEMRLEERDIRDVTIGIGFNVNTSSIPEEIAATASSIYLATGKKTNRADLVAAVWKHFEEDYEQFVKAGSLAPLRAAYERVLVNKGRTVRVLDPQAPFTGRAIGISDLGELLVEETPASEEEAPDRPVIRAVSAGEVSVRSGAATDGDIRTGAGEDSTTRDGFAADGQREHIKVVLCGASKYDQKYYFNWTFDGLPENVKEELHILCVLFTEEVGGIFTIVFTPEGDVEMETQAEEGDLLYDEISCGLMIKEIRRKKQDLFQSLSAYYKIKILHQNPGDVLDSGWDDESDGGQD